MALVFAQLEGVRNPLPPSIYNFYVLIETTGSDESYDKSRIPQIATISSQRRVGNVLPPPVDDMGNSRAVFGKHVVKVASNNASSQVKASPNSNNVGKSTVLPAAASWGLQASNSREPAVSGMGCSQSVIKQNAQAPNSLPSIKLNSTWDDDVVPTSKYLKESMHFILMAKPGPEKLLNLLPQGTTGLRALQI